MAVYNVLIVDDKTATRKTLTRLVDAMNLDSFVVAVPSGEEALLELFSMNFDLLITNYSLPGMNGLELLQKVKRKHTDIHSLLLLDNNLNVAQNPESGIIDRTLSKPFIPADFISTVTHILGISANESEILSKARVFNNPEEKITDRIARLHYLISAKKTLLLDKSGSILVSIGELSEENFGDQILRSVLDAFSCGIKISRSLHASTPFNIQFFTGTDFDLMLIPVGQGTALMVIMNPVSLGHELGDIIQKINDGVNDIRQLLSFLGLNHQQNDEISEGQIDSEELVDEEEFQRETPRFEAVIRQQGLQPTDIDQIDTFWNGIAQNEVPEEVEKPDMLTYNQAQKLGLTSDDL